MYLTDCRWLNESSKVVRFIVVCCCKLNNTCVCDEHFFRQVSTRTGRYQLPIFCCTNVHNLGVLYFYDVMSYNSLTTSVAPSRMIKVSDMYILVDS